MKHRLASFCGLSLCAVLLSGALLNGSALQESRPQLLSQTGLYADIAAKTIHPHNLSFSPQYPLWSDGAAKQRWIFLPEGEQIDASDPNNWIFPVGTKLWKEFSFGAQVETRLIEKIAQDKWAFAAYAWNQDGSDAELVAANGSRNHVEIAQGIRHDIPGVYDCKACHEGTSRDVVLGFNALQLSDDRDSLAPHAEAIASGMITLSDLIERGVFKNLEEGAYAQSPAIKAATPRARAALGYLWSNCGGCHNASDPIASVGMILKLPLDSMFANRPVDLPTVIACRSIYQIPGLPEGESYRVLPGDPAKSSLVFRMGSRNPFRQMPPLGTKIVDLEALELISEWISEDLVIEITDKQ